MADNNGQPCLSPVCLLGDVQCISYRANADGGIGLLLEPVDS